MLDRPDHPAERLHPRTDAMADLLAGVEEETPQPCRAVASGDWVLGFDPVPEVRVGVVLAGRMFLRTGRSDWARLEEGDCFLIADHRTHAVASDPLMTTDRGGPVRTRSTAGLIEHIAGDEDIPDVVVLASGVGGASFAQLALATLFPDLVTIPGSDPRARTLRRTLQLIVDAAEFHADDLTLRQQISRVLLVEVARIMLDDPPAGPGWWRVREDRSIFAAVSAIHDRPGHPWTVDSLASEVHLSRSVFAKRFADLVGVPPSTYLTRWRIHLGRGMLRSGTPVSITARRVGYESESAFSRSYKRLTGVTPVSEIRPGAAAGATETGSALREPA